MINRMLASNHELLIELANLLGTRKRTGGKGHVRHANIKTESEGVRFRSERSRYANGEDRVRLDFQNMLQSFYDGDLSYRDFYQQFKAKMYTHLESSYKLGRRAVGRTDDQLTQEELRMIHGAHSSEMKYFKNFLLDIVMGGGRMSYAQRIDLYALAGYRLYVRGALTAIPNYKTLKYEWIVNEEAEHCESCLEKQRLSKEKNGLTWDELNEIGLPGEKCECGRKCRCHVKPIGYKLNLPRTRPTGYSHLTKKRNDGSPKRTTNPTAKTAYTTRR